MPLPASVTLVTVHGQVLHADGAPAVGSVSFVIPQALRDTTGDVIVGPKTALTGTLDANGEFTVSLPATDDPDITPSGWVYTVHAETDAWRERFEVSIPVATVGTLELADIAPAVPAPAVVSYLLASEKGAANGVATLDAGVKIPVEQIPDLSVTYVPVALQGVADGVATLDGGGKLPVGQAPDLSAVYLALAGGGVVTGDVTIQAAGGVRGYRLRASGAALDVEGAANDLYLSVWSAAGFVGTQHKYLRAEAGTQKLHLIGQVVIGVNEFGEQIKLDPGAIPAVTGAKGGNAALASLLTQLAALGLIVDNTTA